MHGTATINVEITLHELTPEQLRQFDVDASAGARSARNQVKSTAPEERRLGNETLWWIATPRAYNSITLTISSLNRFHSSVAMEGFNRKRAGPAAPGFTTSVPLKRPT